jgi:hypothetical protein
MASAAILLFHVPRVCRELAVARARRVRLRLCRDWLTHGLHRGESTHAHLHRSAAPIAGAATRRPSRASRDASGVAAAEAQPGRHPRGNRQRCRTAVGSEITEGGVHEQPPPSPCCPYVTRRCSLPAIHPERDGSNETEIEHKIRHFAGITPPVRRRHEVRFPAPPPCSKAAPLGRPLRLLAWSIVYGAPPSTLGDVGPKPISCERTARGRSSGARSVSRHGCGTVST